MSLKLTENEDNPENKEATNDITLELQLGDVIQISNPLNEKLDNQIFIIDYIDKSKSYLINTDTLERIKVKISDDGIFGDGNIKRIAILSRSDTPSYAKQHDLVPDKWINIYFGGDFPVIITGEITNLEEDMIEVKTVDGDTLYINFDYKGIPEELPIETIEIREKPQEPLKEHVEREEEQQEEIEMPEFEKEINLVPTEHIQLNVPVKNVKDQLREFIIRADQVVFGDEELGPVVQYVDVSKKSQRYSIETQVADLLDELLSTIPSIERTPRVLNNIHIMIERFKQLRENFSHFDKYNNIEGAKLKEASYKPLSVYFKNFKHNLYWILPIVKNIKKLYSTNDVSLDVDDENTDVVNIQFTQDMFNMDDIIKNYKSNTLPIDQNKYSTLYSELNPYFTPFDLINDENTNGIITEQEVKDDLNVIIDNLEDMYSSVITGNNVRSRRFVIQKYNLGLTRLVTNDSTSSRLITTRINMTQPDTLSVKSFVTLQEPTIRFSKVNLPGTSILDKANLNRVFLNYWELLKKKTNVNSIFVDSINDEIEFEENNFVNNIKNYVLNLNSDETKGISKQEIYNKFIDIIVPKTRILFNLMKKYITGKLSIVDVVSYLEPFLIYTDDLTYMQYVEIIKFINNKISEYNKKFIEGAKTFSLLSKVPSNSIIKTKAYSLISLLTNEHDIKNDVLVYGYDFNLTENVFTNSEFYKKIVLKDYGRLYTTAIAFQNVPLMFPKDISSILDEEKTDLDKKMKNEEGKCETTTIAKMYHSLDELNDDNERTIYFDKKYDKTNYGILDADYEKEIIRLSPEELKEYIVNDLINKKQYSQNDADYMANTLLDGHKKVIDGQYAILFKGYKENVKDQADYYIRKENKWVLDKELSNQDIVTDEAAILCDLQSKCINVPGKIDDKCESIQFDELGLQTKLLKDVISEFDSKYKFSKEEFAKKIGEKYDYLSKIIHIVSKIETNNMLKYNNQKYKLGVVTDEETVSHQVSPNAKLLNLILRQGDFVKKQNDIIRFVNTYTKPDNSNYSTTKENTHWLYCLTTNVPLLPKFKYDLACAYVKDPQGYTHYLELVKSKIGKLSDDGDMWIDEHSGWTICRTDFDVEEGYEDGFKVTSRGVLEEDAGNKITSVAAEKAIKYNTPDSKMINNIVNALSVAMGINIETQKEFIINSVLTSLRDNLESESDYKNMIKEMAQKGKKIASYKDFYNSAILYFTLGMFLISIQTSIPSVKTRKTHPGCVRSFSGYPFEGTGDFSSLNYLGCVAYDIRESGEPWNVLKGKKLDFITNKIKGSIDGVLIAIPEVKRKFDEKTEYLLTNDTNEIPEEHDIAKWLQFLPPLVPFTIKHLANISDEFKRGLMSDLRVGSENQREKILVIESKIIQFSLAIQDRIQEVVKKHQLILHNSNNEPYLENACCQSREGETTIGYFINKEPRIVEYNQIVSRLTNMMADIIDYSKGGLFYSNINTKNKYPLLSNDFNEKTIYLAFIYFCKFKSLIPMPEDLIPICTDKPDITLINPTDSIDRIIQKLKDDGRNYTNEQFLRLLQLVGRTNIIDINFDRLEVSSVTRLLGLLETIENENDTVVDPDLSNLIQNALDTFDIATENSIKEVKDLNNFLIKEINAMKEDLTEFIEKNYGSNIPKSSIKKAIKYIKDLSVWSADDSTRNENIKISSENMYNVVNFYKTFIENFAVIFPNIILNKVDYTDVLIPGYLGFSSTHAKKIKKYIGEYYEKLRTFYGLESLTNVLNTIQKITTNLVKMSKETPCFSTIRNGDKILKPVFDERTSKYFYEYYLLRVLITYIELAEEDNMIVKEVIKETELTDLYSVEYLEEKETKVDLVMSSRTQQETLIQSGNKKELRQKVTQLLVAFIDIMNNQKETVDTSYEEIEDRVFKLREREKDMVTDRLKLLTDELRDTDTMLKINKLGQYSKGLQKGLTVLDKDFYDEEREFRDEMVRAEKVIRKNNKGVTDDNIDQLMDDYLEQREVENEIDDEVYDMEYMDEDYYDGRTDGVGAPEEDYDDYHNYE